jgi:hypothetical protein
VTPAKEKTMKFEDLGYLNLCQKNLSKGVVHEMKDTEGRLIVSFEALDDLGLNSRFAVTCPMFVQERVEDFRSFFETYEDGEWKEDPSDEDIETTTSEKWLLAGDDNGWGLIYLLFEIDLQISHIDIGTSITRYWYDMGQKYDLSKDDYEGYYCYNCGVDLGKNRSYPCEPHVQLGCKQCLPNGLSAHCHEEEY